MTKNLTTTINLIAATVGKGKSRLMMKKVIENKDKFNKIFAVDLDYVDKEVRAQVPNLYVFDNVVEMYDYIVDNNVKNFDEILVLIDNGRVNLQPKYVESIVKDFTNVIVSVQLNRNASVEDEGAKKLIADEFSAYYNLNEEIKIETDVLG